MRSAPKGSVLITPEENGFFHCRHDFRLEQEALWRAF